MAEFDPQEFGRLQAQVEQLLESVKTLSGKVDNMSQQMSEASGGWKVLMALGTVSAGLGSAATWALSHFTGKGLS
jgi:hypothetical protein